MRIVTLFVSLPDLNGFGETLKIWIKVMVRKVRAVLNYLSKIIWNCGFGFVFLLSVIGPETLHHILDQSNSKSKPIATSQSSFLALQSSAYVFTLSPYRPLVLFSIVLKGRLDYFGFGFATLDRNCALISLMQH